MDINGHKCGLNMIIYFIKERKVSLDMQSRHFLHCSLPKAGFN